MESYITKSRDYVPVFCWGSNRSSERDSQSVSRLCCSESNEVQCLDNN